MCIQDLSKNGRSSCRPSERERERERGPERGRVSKTATWFEVPHMQCTQACAAPYTNMDRPVRASSMRDIESKNGGNSCLTLTSCSMLELPWLSMCEGFQTDNP
jgi:hypothetical protein